MEKHNPIPQLELYIIRHGESVGNVGYGRDNLTLKEACDPVLTPKGESQADLLGKYLSKIDFDAVYSSGLIRAIQTAKGILNHQRKEKPLNILPYVTELSVTPEYSGISKDELNELCPLSALAEGLDTDSPFIAYTPGKDKELINNRCDDTIRYMTEKYKEGEKVALVSHAAFMTNLIFRIMGLNEDPAFDIDIDNTGITKVTYFKKGTNKYGDITFNVINSTTHLE